MAEKGNDHLNLGIGNKETSRIKELQVTELRRNKLQNSEVICISSYQHVLMLGTK